MIDIACTRCGRIYHTEERHLGKSIRCAQCGEIVLLFSPKEQFSSGAQIAARGPSTPAQRFGPWLSVFTRRASPSVQIGVWAVILVCIIVALSLLKSTRPSTNAAHHETERNTEASSNTPQSEAQPKAEAGPTVQWDAAEEPTTAATERSPRQSKPSAKAPHAEDDVIDQLPRQRSFSKSSHATASRNSLSLPTGTRIVPDSGALGHGELVFRNGNPLDAAVRVLDSRSDATIRWVYVGAGGDLKLDRIPPGSYIVLVALGLDWDYGSMRFRKRAVYKRVDKLLAFDESETTEGIEYGRHTLTLNAVTNGNTPATTKLARLNSIAGLGFRDLSTAE